MVVDAGMATAVALVVEPMMEPAGVHVYVPPPPPADILTEPPGQTDAEELTVSAGVELTVMVMVPVPGQAVLSVTV